MSPDPGSTVKAYGNWLPLFVAMLSPERDAIIKANKAA
jgi:hypothetical protein